MKLPMLYRNNGPTYRICLVTAHDDNSIGGGGRVFGVSVRLVVAEVVAEMEGVDVGESLD